MIYYRQGDMKSFNSERFTEIQQFLALFLLGKKDIIEKYISRTNFYYTKSYYQYFIDLLNKK